MNQSMLDYLSYIEHIKHYSERTVSSYFFDLKSFDEFLEATHLKVDEVIDKDVQEYMNHLKLNKYKATSINRKIICLRNFYKYYCTHIDVNASNPMIGYVSLKTPTRLPHDLFVEQVKVLLVSNEKNPNLALRNQCMILLLLYTGMRVSELCNLDLIDIDLQDQTIRVFGKESKERSVFFQRQLVPYLNDYLVNVRPTLLKDNKSEAVFIGSKGTRITPRAVENILNARAAQAEIPFKVTPHMLRHTFATNLLNNDVDLKVVQELLGHSSISTTQIYTHISHARLKEVYNKTHPMAKQLEKYNKGH